MMVIAMERKKASVSRGAMPRIVVAAASTTGRRRDVDASVIAWRSGFMRSALRRRSISSTRTIPFLISMPDRLSSPSSAVKLNGASVSRRPMVTPLTDMGTRSQMMIGCRSALNRSTEISTMMMMLMGNCWPRAALASEDDSNSPPHSSM